ncbi:MAG: alpha/beta hydrolase, partial [Oligosphaeraceae bacterium]|nr:alpha/beta hydrolase [Oligosphaeraceae bacterium]
TLTPFILPGERVRPCVLVIPGGGYHCVCSASEGAPIAQRFNQLGFHAAVLHYRVKPAFFPAPVEDAIRAMRIIRGQAGSWHINPSCIAVCGFSAGGHLAACLGTSIAQGIPALAGDDYDRYEYVPNYLLLSYSVLSFTQNRNPGCAENLLGKERANQEKLSFSPDQCVTRHTPPAFIWHTLTDQIVDYNSSVLFAQAMAAQQRPCELHLFPRGDHGMLLGLHTPDLAIWPTLAKRFINAQEKFSPKLAPRYTNPYQCQAEKNCPGPGK